MKEFRTVKTTLDDIFQLVVSNEVPSVVAMAFADWTGHVTDDEIETFARNHAPAGPDGPLFDKHEQIVATLHKWRRNYSS